MCRTSRGGFSLVEMLVVVGIIGVLMGMILPAVQKVRETANRMKCSNNLRQIGMAAQHFHDEHRVLPSLGWYDPRGRVYPPYYATTLLNIPGYPHPTILPSVAGSRLNTAGWGFQLLPYLDQDALFRGSESRGISPNAPQEYRLKYDNRGIGVHTALGTPLGVYRCPSRGEARVFTLRSNPFRLAHPFPWDPVGEAEMMVPNPAPKGAPGRRTPVTVAQTDYAANGGIGMADRSGPFWYVHMTEFGDRPLPRRGVQRARTRSFNDIPDGLTHTALFGEKLVNRAQTHRPQADDIYGYASSYTSSTVRWCGGPSAGSVRTPQRDFDAAFGVTAGGRFGSAHPTATMFAFADGSARPVGFEVDPSVFYSLCIVNDGRAVTEADYE